MSKAIISIYIAIIICKIRMTRVVWRIDVDDINLSLMGIAEGGECFEVVALNQYMIRSIRLVAQQRLVFHFA